LSASHHYMKHNLPWLDLLLLGLAVAVFAVDLWTPLGISLPIFYFLPIALAAFGRNPGLPIVLAGLSTAFCIIGFFLKGGDHSNNIVWAATINRSFAVVTLWGIAILVAQVVRTRNIVERATWLKAGQAQLADKLRGDHDVAQTAASTLALFARYLDAVVGVFYGVSARSGYLQRLAGFAFSESANARPAFAHEGDGLVGQVVRDNRVMVVDDVPPQYLNLSSGLGNAAPRFLLAAPLRADGKVEGVIELGFLQKPDSRAIELFEQCSEMAGMALRSARHKARLAELLAQSQQQAEELQTQQEELRVTNEELEQQTRALKESQTLLENRQAELEQTNQQLEAQAQTLEQQKEALAMRNQELLRVQQELRNKAAELERASQYKSEFLANMSHELRTPLNSSLILSKLLADNKHGNLTAEQIKYAQTIYASGNDLLHLINDILDLAKVESGKMELKPEPFPTARVLQSLDAAFAPLASQKGLRFHIETEANVPPHLNTDRHRLEQVLRNFLSNALKFTEHGEIRLRAMSDAHGIAFAVTDTGIGIPPHQQDVIFEAFRQADGTTNRKYGGTGLGLSISRQLARLLGGTIDVVSDVGKGSTFTLRLPVTLSVGTPEAVGTRPADAATASPAAVTPVPVKEHPLPSAASARDRSPFSFDDDRQSADRAGKKILIVEDDERFARILFDLAHEGRYACLLAATGDEALSLARKYRPNAILLDIRLPDDSGLSVLEQLKSDSRTRHIPVHVISGEDFAKAALHMGAVGYLRKPVKQEQLAKAFADLEGRINQRIKRVLVVEDDATQRESMVKLISDNRVELVAVATGKEALEKLSSETFDCMIIDLNLPDLSGYELLEQLAQVDSPYAYPPVIVYTGRELSHADEQRLRRYSESIIVKGAKSPERLLSEVTLFLHRVESELPPERQRMLKELRGREQALHERKLLIVDDDVRNIFALKAALEPYGATIEIARNGREALEKLDRSPDTDLVLMDVMMPEMDGHEATRRIRQQKRFERLPVIAVTAKAMRDDQEKSVAAGANDYLAKPIEVDKLLSLIRVWMPPAGS
jgi:signal transduction histidine kinase/DNA-binding response OmpR family regulator